MVKVKKDGEVLEVSEKAAKLIYLPAGYEIVSDVKPEAEPEAKQEPKDKKKSNK